MMITDRSGDVLLPEGLAGALAADGLVFLSAAGRDDVMLRLSPLLRVYPHPHAEDGGWTLIRPDDRPYRATGRQGFTAAALAPHTDRSFLRSPPTLLCFLLLDSARSGGDALLADTAAVSRRFTRAELGEIQDTLWLTDPSGRSRQRVLSVDRGQCVNRYRNDPLGIPRPGSAQADAFLTGLREVAATPLRVPLRAGEGYVVHNHRLLHGRTAFTGARRGARLLGYVRDSSPYAWLNDGYTIHPERRPKVRR